MPDIKRDLRQTVADVGALQEATRALTGAIQQLFGSLGQFNGAAAGNIAPAAPADMLTGTGQREATLAAVQTALNNRGVAGPNVQTPESGGKIVYMPTAAGNRAVRLPSAEQAYSQALVGSINNSAQSGDAAKAQGGTAPNLKTSYGQDLAGIGYSMADLPRILQASGGASQVSASLAQSVEKLSKSTDRNSQDIALALKEISRDLNQNNQKFISAMERWREVAASPVDSPERIAAQRELMNAMGQLDTTLRASDQGLRHGGGGGGGGDGGSWRDIIRTKAMEWGRPAGQILGALTAIGGAGLHTSIAMGDVAYGKGLSAEAAAGAIAGRSFGMQMAGFDMTNPENILKYRANILMPQSQFKYIGTNGLRNAIGAALGDEGLKIDLDRQRRFLGVLGGVGSVAAGVGKGVIGASAIGGTGGVGALIGAGMMADAARDITGGTASAITSWISSPATAMSGDLNKGLTGAIGELFYPGKWGSMSDAAKRSALAESKSRVLEMAAKFQSAEVAQRPETLAALGEYQSMMQAQREAAILVGSYAMPARDVLSRMGTGGIVSQDSLMYNISTSTPPASAVSQARSYRAYAEFSNADFKRAIARNESGGRYDIWNASGSGAYGKYQFIGATRKSLASIMGISPTDFILTGDKAHDAKAIQYQERGMDILIDEYRGDAAALRKNKQLAAAGYINHFDDFQLAMMVHHRGYSSARQILATGKDPFAKVGKDIHTFNYSRLKPSDSDLYRQSFGLPSSGAAPTITSPITEASREGLYSTPYAELGISPAEFMMRNAQYTNVIGRGAASGAATSRMISLGYSGLGSFDQQIQSLATLNRAAGGQDNSALLERILSSAVAAGFDKSRTAQMFVQNTADVMNALKATTGLTGGMLSTAATALGGGAADERTMSIAASGLKSFGAYTGQTTGLPGAVKALAVAQAGLGLGRGFATAIGMNAIERMDAIRQLEGQGTLSVDTRTLLESSGLGRGELAARLRKVATAESSAALGILKFGGLTAAKGFSSIEEEAAAIAGAKGKPREKMIESFLFRTRDSAAATAMGADAGIGAGLDILSRYGVDISSADAKTMEARIKSGKSLAIDPAVVLQRKAMDTVLADFSANIRKVDMKTYESWIQGGGARINISAEAARAAGDEKLAGRAIDPSMKGAAQRAAEMTLNQMTTLDLARGGEMARNEALSNVQRVTIENWREGMLYLQHSVTSQNLNRSTISTSKTNQ